MTTALDPNTLQSAAAESAAPDEEALSAVAALVSRQITLEDEVALAEEALREKKAELERVRTDLLPSALRQHNLTELRTADGFRVVVNEITRASIPKARREEAFAWLDAAGHGDLIKHVVSAKFGKGEDEQAAEAADRLTALGCSVSDERSVHASTLSAFVREQLAAGEALPHELLGVFQGHVSKIER
jgi:hypothetical protein